MHGLVCQCRGRAGFAGAAPKGSHLEKERLSYGNLPQGGRGGSNPIHNNDTHLVHTPSNVYHRFHNSENKGGWGQPLFFL